MDTGTGDRDGALFITILHHAFEWRMVQVRLGACAVMSARPGFLCRALRRCRTAERRNSAVPPPRTLPLSPPPLLSSSEPPSSVPSSTCSLLTQDELTSQIRHGNALSQPAVQFPTWTVQFLPGPIPQKLIASRVIHSQSFTSTIWALPLHLQNPLKTGHLSRTARRVGPVELVALVCGAPVVVSEQGRM